MLRLILALSLIIAGLAFLLIGLCLLSRWSYILGGGFLIMEGIPFVTSLPSEGNLVIESLAFALLMGALIVGRRQSSRSNPE